MKPPPPQPPAPSRPILTHDPHSGDVTKTPLTPQPLTQCDPPALDWSRPETPAAADFGDIYFSVDGGLRESQNVFLAACDLPNAWLSSQIYTIGELGFGTGLNFLATWQLWEKTSGPGHLHFVSVEKYPFSTAQLTKALQHFPQISDLTTRLIDLWPGRVKGLHRLELAPNVTLTLVHDDIEAALSSLSATVDAWYLDGFSPSKNPDMWSPKIIKTIAQHSRDGTRLASFTVAGSVRQALTDAGFEVSKKKGFGRKRHRLEAVFVTDNERGASEADKPANRPLSPIIIGGGIAGASVCRAFLRHGIHPLIIEASKTLDRAASGNAAALIKPRFDLQDRPESRFFLSSYLFATQLYEASGGVIGQGVVHLSATEKEQKRAVKLCNQAALDDRHLRLTPEGLDLMGSQVIAPRDVLETWKAGCEVLTATVGKILRRNEGYIIFDKDGREIAQGDAVILCAGTGIADFEIPGLEDLRYSRGQLTWASLTHPLNRAITYGGYGVPTPSGETLLGATHTRLDGTDPYALKADDDTENLMKFRDATGQEAQKSVKASRASIRVTTPGTLPRVKAIDPNFWVMTGLGSRGFVFAPLLGVHIVETLLGGVSPLSQDVRDRFSFGNTPEGEREA